MGQMIQALEPRAMMSASSLTVVADGAKLYADASALRTTLHDFLTNERADIKALVATAKTLPKTAENKAIVGKLLKDSARATGLVAAAVAKLTAVERGAVQKIIKDGLKLAMKPDNAALQSKLAADIAKAQALAAPSLLKLATAMQTAGETLTADMDAVAAANPDNSAFASAKTKLQTDGTAAGEVISGQLIRIQADFAQFTADLG